MRVMHHPTTQHFDKYHGIDFNYLLEINHHLDK